MMSARRPIVMVSGPEALKRLAPTLGSQKDALHTHAPAFHPLAMPPKSSFKFPLQDQAPYPPMEPAEPQASVFLDRVYDVARRWVQEEWICIEAIKRTAPNTGNARIAEAINEARLTPVTLAKRLDNISGSSLKRELKKLGAPPPGQIIRATRIQFAMHLLIHTRISIRDVAARAGYSNQQHFATIFRQETNCPPLDFRKRHLLKTKKPKPTAIRRKPKP